MEVNLDEEEDGEYQLKMGKQCLDKNDVDTAITWYIRACEQKDRKIVARAIYQIERHFANKGGNYMKWEHSAAEIGLHGYCCSLGKMYFHGNQIERDYKKGVEYFKKCVQNGYNYCKFCRYMLGYAYQTGKGVNDVDLKESAKWYLYSWKAGDIDAGHRYIQVCRSLQAYDTAWKFCKENFHPKGNLEIKAGRMYALMGDAYLFGFGDVLPVDREKGIEYLKKGIEYYIDLRCRILFVGTLPINNMDDIKTIRRTYEVEYDIESGFENHIERSLAWMEIAKIYEKFALTSELMERHTKYCIKKSLEYCP